eukprot:3876467-Rhodomonas_salina.1
MLASHELSGGVVVVMMWCDGRGWWQREHNEENNIRCAVKQSVQCKDKVQWRWLPGPDGDQHHPTALALRALLALLALLLARALAMPAASVVTTTATTTTSDSSSKKREFESLLPSSSGISSICTGTTTAKRPTLRQVGHLAASV